MGNTKRLFFVPVLALLALTGCDMGTGGLGDDYYEVKFYSDYEGIDYEHPDADSAIYLGHAYVRKDSELKAAKLLNVEKDGEGNPIDYKTTRQADRVGKHAEYDGWIGYKENNTPVDLEEITESCSVFAKFNWLDNYYNVKVLSQGISLFDGKLIHGSTIIDATNTPGTPFDYEHVAYVNMPYYKTYTLLGYDVTIDGYTEELSFSETGDVEIVSDIKFEARWDDGVNNSFTVSFSDGHDDEVVEYDAGVTYVPANYATAAGETMVFDHFEGTYAVGPLSGRSVDPKHIRYDCTLTPKFKSQPLTVTFKYQDAVLAEHSVAFGQAIEPVSVTGLPVDMVATGDWFDNSGCTGEPYDLSSITEDVTLYAGTVSKTKTVSGTKGGRNYTFSYRYDSKYKGYGLEDFDVDGLIALEASDFVGSGVFDPRYPIVSIVDFDLDGESEYEYITIIELPSTLKAIYADAMMAFCVASLDLTNCTQLVDIEFHAFRRCLSLEELRLPGSLLKVGSKICEGNLSMTSLYLDMTQAEFNQKKTAGEIDFASNWNAGFESITSYAS